jgi:hypothetical protein
MAFIPPGSSLIPPLLKGVSELIDIAELEI